jgi:peptidoglycan L-alanyl-D-glutamate endopeptidase CwlK
MPKLGKRSKEKLAECHPDLQRIAEEAIKYTDFTVYEGHRTVEQQQIYFKAGKSKIDGINRKGKHNYKPSMAFDCAPWHNEGIEWNNQAEFGYLAGVMFVVANQLLAAGEITHRLRWGGNWDGDAELLSDQRFDDLPHFELV